MSLNFQELTIDSRKELEPYFKSREFISCEYNFNVMFLWTKYNKTKYAVKENYLVINHYLRDKLVSIMPICKEEYFKEAFEDILDYYKSNDLKLTMFSADKIFVDFVKNNYGDRFQIETNRDYFDYIYNADELRTLKGKKYAKKRNHINAFMKEYDGKFEYKALKKEDKDDACKFLRGWKRHHDEITNTLESELTAVCRMIDNLDKLDIKCGVIYVDGRIEALSMGSLINNGKEAVIHVEKANADMRGMYPLINQQFLLNEFPDVEIVNREEDLGIEGLRKAKLSYNPIKLLEKYNIIEK